MTPVRVACRVGVVLEEVDLPADPLFLEPLLGRADQALEDPLPGLVVRHEVVEAVAFGGGVLRMASHVEVEASPVLEEHVGGAAPTDHPAKQIASYLVRAEPALAAERAGDSVLVLDPEYSPFHSRRR